MAKILFTADLHGKEKQYSKVYKKAEKENIDILIFGGDLAPKNKLNRNIADQRKFFSDVLFKYTKEYYENTGNITYLILGNDDFRANQLYLENESESNKFVIFHDKVLSIDNLNLIGYSFVNITPFKFKDWEKADLIDEYESFYLDNYIIKGTTTENGYIEDKIVDLIIRKDTIENDLDKLLAKANKKIVIFVSHCPPYNTVTDQISNNKHVGSKAIKKAIIKFQPDFSFYGHIHETIEQSGKFTETIGNAVIFAPSNNFLEENVAVIILDTNERNYEREIF
jgi:Icc-related predicted phosphoesterase